MNSKLRNNLSALTLSTALLAAGFLLGRPVPAPAPGDTALAEPAAEDAVEATEVGGALPPLRATPGPLPVLTMPYFSFAPLLPRRAGS